MKKWWKARSRPEKWMIVIIVMLIIGIILRWEFVSKEAGDAFKSRFEKDRTEQQVDTPQ